MDVSQIRELIQALGESDVDEVTIEENGGRITVRKGATNTNPHEVTVEDAAVVPPATLTPKGTTVPASTSIADAHPDNWKAVTSPMVGTFYAAPSPDADPFVSVGDIVEAGGNICIVEAMKLMNEITAETRCEIKEICVKNEEPVEFGTVLYYVEPVE